MTTRHTVEAAHLLRAALDDAVVGQVLGACGTTAGEVRLSLDRRWLDTLDGLDGPDDEALHARPVELADVLRDLGPGSAATRWQGREVSPGAREVLVGALQEAAKVGVDRVASWHLLVGLAGSRDPLVAGALADHRISARDVRRLTRRLGRRA